MSALKKATIYVNEDLHKAARIQAAESDKSISDVINEALANYFADIQDDIEDLKVVKKRLTEPRVPMEKILKKMKADGLI